MAQIVTVSAPAKLTLSLRVVGVRADGMHLIEAEMVTLDLYDTLVIDPEGDGLEIYGGGADIPTGPNNLVNRALELAERSAGVRLTKRIPSQAGLGGGSSDAGAILRWAGFHDLDAAASIGADVAFCTVGGRAQVSGIGEVIEPLEHVDRVFTLVTPPLLCPTPQIYRAWDELGGPRHNDLDGNDLEPAALAVVPELASWRDQLQDATGSRPMLAGSGSTWFVEGDHPGPDRTVVRTTPAGWEPNG